MPVPQATTQMPSSRLHAPNVPTATTHCLPLENVSSVPLAITVVLQPLTPPSSTLLKSVDGASTRTPERPLARLAVMEKFAWRVSSMLHPAPAPRVLTAIMTLVSFWSPPAMPVTTRTKHLRQQHLLVQVVLLDISVPEDPLSNTSAFLEVTVKRMLMCPPNATLVLSTQTMALLPVPLASHALKDTTALIGVPSLRNAPPDSSAALDHKPELQPRAVLEPSVEPWLSETPPTAKLAGPVTTARPPLCSQHLVQLAPTTLIRVRSTVLLASSAMLATLAHMLVSITVMLDLHAHQATTVQLELPIQLSSLARLVPTQIPSL